MKLKKILASILCAAMVLSTMSFSAFAEDTTVATVNEVPYTSLADALEAASAVDGAVTVELTADVKWETGAEHGSTPFVPEESEAIVTINGNDYTITATGAGVGPIRAANGTLLTFNNVNFVDESVSYAEDSWEFTYLEFAGKLKFTDCDFKDEISVDSEAAEFVGCTFESNEENVYAVWVSNGSVSFTENCYFTGYRGIKMHEAYGSEITAVTVEGCKFENITKKPGIAIGDLNADTQVAVENCEFVNVQAGDQGSYVFESDTDVSAFTFESEENKIVNGTITPGYTNNTSVWGEGGANAKESFVVELYAEEEKIGQASLNDYEDIIDGDLYVTWNINFAGEDSEYWTVDWYGNNPSVDTVPTKVVLLADGVKVAENIVKMCAPDDLNPVKWDELEGVSAAARIGKKGYSSVKAAIADAEAQGLTNVEIEVFVDFLLSDIVLKNNSSITDLTITGNDDVTMDVEDKLYGLNNKNYTLNNLTVSGMTRWQGDVYFADMGLQSGNVTFNDCTLNGLYTLYQGKFVFDGCVINGETNKYSIMVYASKDVTFTDCVFNSDNKAIKVFGYGTFLENAQVNISGTKFYASATENVKAVVEMDLTQQTNPAVDLTIEDSFALGFAEGSETGNVWYNVELPAGKTDENISSVVTDSTAYQCGDITVAFENATDADGKEIAGLYNIVLNAADGADIYEFVGAELTFANTSKTVANEYMNYEIIGISGTTNAEKSIEKADTYALRLVDGAERMTGNKLPIGQVKFYGQGDINFTVSVGKVVATEYGTNLPKYYTLDADDTTDDTLKVDAITNGAVEEVTRNVIVNVAYNLGLDGTYWEDNQITVTLKDGFGNVYDAEDLTNGVATINNVKLGRLTVTLEAPGFRKYVYNTTLEAGADANDALVLNFWNNVKRNEELNGVVVEPLAEIETGKGFMAHNFVVGDIVMDYTVDEYDLAAVTSYYGMYDLTDADKYIKYDLNRDGNIDITDVHYVLHTLNN